LNQAARSRHIILVTSVVQ